MARVMHQSGLRSFGGVPSAAGALSRHASARARAAGVDVGPLMARAGVTQEQVEDDSVRLTVESQIKFIELVAHALQDDFVGFHIAQSFDLREMGLLYMCQRPPRRSAMLCEGWNATAPLEMKVLYCASTRVMISSLRFTTWASNASQIDIRLRLSSPFWFVSADN